MDYLRHLYAANSPELGKQCCSGDGCSRTGQLSRCNDCSTTRLYCSRCLIKRHNDLPFHRIYKLKSSPSPHFEETSLKALGHVLCIHTCDMTCTGVKSQFSLKVRHINGVHDIIAESCSCVERWKCLLALRIATVTRERPQSAFTFDILDDFCLLNLKSKISPYDYLNALALRTDPVHFDSVSVREAVQGVLFHELTRK